MFGVYAPYLIMLLFVAGFALLWWGFMKIPIPGIIKTGLIVCLGILGIVFAINYLSGGQFHPETLFHQ